MQKGSSQFSVLSSQFSVLSSQFSVLSSQFSVLSSQFSVLSSQFSVLSWRSYGAEGCFGSCNSVGLDESSFRTECWLKDGRGALRESFRFARRFVTQEHRDRHRRREDQGVRKCCACGLGGDRSFPRDLPAGVD